MEGNRFGKLLRKQLGELLDLNEVLSSRVEQLEAYILRAGLELPSTEAGMNAPIVELGYHSAERSQKRLRTDVPGTYSAIEPVNDSIPWKVLEQSIAESVKSALYAEHAYTAPEEQQYEEFQTSEEEHEPTMNISTARQQIQRQETQNGLSPRMSRTSQGNQSRDTQRDTQRNTQRDTPRGSLRDTQSRASEARVSGGKPNGGRPSDLRLSRLSGGRFSGGRPSGSRLSLGNAKGDRSMNSSRQSIGSLASRLNDSSMNRYISNALDTWANRSRSEQPSESSKQYWEPSAMEGLTDLENNSQFWEDAANGSSHRGSEHSHTLHGEVPNEVPYEPHEEAHEEAHEQAHEEAHEEAHEGAHEGAHEEAHEQAHDEAHEQAHEQAHGEAHEQVSEESHEDALEKARNEETYKASPRSEDAQEDAHTDDQTELTDKYGGYTVESIEQPSETGEEFTNSMAPQHFEDHAGGQSERQGEAEARDADASVPRTQSQETGSQQDAEGTSKERSLHAESESRADASPGDRSKSHAIRRPARESTGIMDSFFRTSDDTPQSSNETTTSPSRTNDTSHTETGTRWSQSSPSRISLHSTNSPTRAMNHTLNTDTMEARAAPNKSVTSESDQSRRSSSQFSNLVSSVAASATKSSAPPSRPLLYGRYSEPPSMPSKERSPAASSTRSSTGSSVGALEAGSQPGSSGGGSTGGGSSGGGSSAGGSSEARPTRVGRASEPVSQRFSPLSPMPPVPASIMRAMKKIDAAGMESGSRAFSGNSAPTLPSGIKSPRVGESQQANDKSPLDPATKPTYEDKRASAQRPSGDESRGLSETSPSGDQSRNASKISPVRADNSISRRASEQRPTPEGRQPISSRRASEIRTGPSPTSTTRRYAPRMYDTEQPATPQAQSGGPKPGQQRSSQPVGTSTPAPPARSRLSDTGDSAVYYSAVSMLSGSRENTVSPRNVSFKLPTSGDRSGGNSSSDTITPNSSRMPMLPRLPSQPQATVAPSSGNGPEPVEKQPMKSVPARRRLNTRNVYELDDSEASLPDMSEMKVDPGDISDVRGRPKSLGH